LYKSIRNLYFGTVTKIYQDDIILQCQRKQIGKEKSMMKKSIALLLVLIMCVFSASALGQAAEPTILTVEAKYAGAELTIEPAAVGLLVPADWVAAEVTGEQAAQGLVFNCTSPDGAVTLQVQCAQTEGQTLDTTYAALSATEGVSDVTLSTINGISYIAYTLAATNSACLITEVKPSMLLSFVFTAADMAAIQALDTLPIQIAGSVHALAE
jgi:hypothetical protein